MELHPIQQAILSQIIASPNGLRYCQMQLEEVENDRYNYHLQYLVKLGLLEKNHQQYQLSSTGKQFILETRPIDLAGHRVDKFKLAALALVLRWQDGELQILLQIRGCQPFVGRHEIIGGSIRKGEKIVDAASRRLQEEAGLNAAFSHFGAIRKMRYSTVGELYSDIVYHICITNHVTGELIQENEFGHRQWVPIDVLIEQERTVPSGSPQWADILEQLKTQDPKTIPLFYFEEESVEDIY